MRCCRLTANKVIVALAGALFGSRVWLLSLGIGTTAESTETPQQHNGTESQIQQEVKLRLHRDHKTPMLTCWNELQHLSPSAVDLRGGRLNLSRAVCGDNMRVHGHSRRRAACFISPQETQALLSLSCEGAESDWKSVPPRTLNLFVFAASSP